MSQHRGAVWNDSPVIAEGGPIEDSSYSFPHGQAAEFSVAAVVRKIHGAVSHRTGLRAMVLLPLAACLSRG